MDNKNLEEIRQLGALSYTPQKVAMIMGLDDQQLQELINDADSPLFKQYWAGFYETDMKVRKSVFDLAAKGSSPAQAEARRLLEAAETRRFYEQ